MNVHKIRTKRFANFMFPEKEKHSHNFPFFTYGDDIQAFAVFYKS
jgi:hypothetical protein